MYTFFYEPVRNNYYLCIWIPFSSLHNESVTLPRGTKVSKLVHSIELFKSHVSHKRALAAAMQRTVEIEMETKIKKLLIS